MTKVAGKRARLYGPGDLRFEDISVDTALLSPNEICAVTEYSAVSVGTEKAAYIGIPALRSGPAYPRLVGYCNAARVIGLGADVADLSLGDRILTHQSHQSCFICPATEVLATIPHGVDSRSASLTYIAHLGLNALQRAGFQSGETVAVQGLGPIGLATVALARALGARRIIAIGNAPSRLATAAALGATATLDAMDPEIVGNFAELNGGDYADVVVTTVNAWSAWRTTLMLVREFGRVAVLGFPGRGEPPPAFNPFEAELFYTRQPSILSVGLAAGPGQWGDGDREEHRRRNMEFLLDLAATGALPLADLITHEFAWSDLEQVYRRAAEGDKDMIVPVLRWSPSS